MSRTLNLILSLIVIAENFVFLWKTVKNVINSYDSEISRLNKDVLFWKDSSGCWQKKCDEKCADIKFWKDSSDYWKGRVSHWQKMYDDRSDDRVALFDYWYQRSQDLYEKGQAEYKYYRKRIDQRDCWLVEKDLEINSLRDKNQKQFLIILKFFKETSAEFHKKIYQELADVLSEKKAFTLDKNLPEDFRDIFVDSSVRLLKYFSFSSSGQDVFISFDKNLHVYG